MSLPSGTRLAQYQVLALLGAGGMGEVYRATDTRLGRDVAIKVLPTAVAQDPERLGRFRREAQMLASLNHPNIAAIYGLEESDGLPFLAMELVGGDDLAQRLARGPIPVDEAIEIAKQMAAALEAAHASGIVHRDLKPANVKVTPDRKVKVLDFGLAKAYAGDTAAGSSGDVSQSPTFAHTGTSAGIILGTAAYMSPEQARGRSADKRSDIWAFGVVLFELLTGKRLFGGDTISDVLAAVLTTRPELDALPAGVPPRVRRLLRRCLQKDASQRLHDIADARIELEEEDEPWPAASSVSAPRRTRDVLPWAAAAIAIVSAAGWTLFGPARSVVRSDSLTLAALPPSGAVSSGHIDLSADGRQLVFTATDVNGRRRIYVRSLDALEARALAGSEGGDAPFFSPDGRSVGFFAEGKLKRISLAGGPPRELAEAPDHRGGSWGSQNLIVFAPDGGGPIYRVPAAGGDAVQVTKLDAAKQETSHRWPRFLTDGRRFLFMSRKPKPPGRLAVEAGSVDGTERTRLVDSSTGGAAARGQLYFIRETTLFAQPFDTRALTVSGEPVPVAEDVWRNPNPDGLTAFAIAENGTLIYRRGGLARSQLTWLDRQGQALRTMGPPAIIGAVALSPDGRQALADIVDPARDLTSLFVLDDGTGTTTRVAFGVANQLAGIYSPDGRHIALSSDSKGAFELYRQEIGAAGEPTPLVVNKIWKFPESWSRDGRFVSYMQSDPGKPKDIWIVPMTGEGRPFPFAQTPADEWGSAFSPDGRFIAYVSDESGRPEVFIRPFPSSPTKWQVSAGGGIAPAWRGDGKELYYLSPDQKLVAVPIVATAGGLQRGTAQTLFQNQNLTIPVAGTGNSFAVSADGQRFLAILQSGQAESSPIVVRTDASP